MSDPDDTPSTAASPVKQDRVPTEPALREFTPAPETAPLEFESGDPIPHREMWLLDRRLGGGGFGEVWLAKHEYDRVPPVAVKFCTHANRLKLATHEKKVIVRVMKHGGHHPNVVPLLDCNLSGETPWLIYEYVPGGTLADAFEEWRALPFPERVVRTARTLHAVASALALFHQFEPPIVHRDMKPHNVLMAGNVPRITDFGIGALALGSDDVTHSTRLPTLLRGAGTRGWSSQEQLSGHPPHPRDDVYALGVIAYQLLAADIRTRPGSDAAEELREWGTPPALITLITRSVATNPERRPKDAREWEIALAAWLPAKPATDPVAPTPVHSTARKLALGTPGTWSTRPESSEVGWSAVTETPATIHLPAGTEFALRVKSTATDGNLENLKALAAVSAFRSLDLSWCEQVTDAGLAYLSSLHRLDNLDLSGCSQVTDAGLAHLRTLTGLRQLDLSCCSQITDAGLVHIRALTGLRHLSILICERLTDAGVAAFQQAVPGCKIKC